jgi:hypothetical protein
MTMPPVTVVGSDSARHIQGRKQRCHPMTFVIMCAVNGHHYSTDAECIDKLGGTKTEDRALRTRNSRADFGAGMRQKSDWFPPAYILAKGEKFRTCGGGVPI